VHRGIVKGVIPPGSSRDSGLADTHGRRTVGTDRALQPLWSERKGAIDAYWESHSMEKRHRVNDRLLERVALLYREAIAGGRRPEKAVLATFNASEPSAGRYICARDRGYLGKTRPGKKDEISA
jgi:hypothetical protein